MKDCIFCKVVRGEIPSARVYEDENIIAFLDIAPVHKGHTLVIAKEHYETIMELPDRLLQELAVAVKRVSRAVMRATNAGGISLSLANHGIAGQTVPHAHFHVMPRFEGDGLRHWPQGKYAEGEMKEYSEKIKASME
ncbi:HIT family protein [Candidatus Woesearchaeota archaeon]|nr:HIT family protein [Candidatus Woesearchaeota archaeon]